MWLHPPPAHLITGQLGLNESLQTDQGTGAGQWWYHLYTKVRNYFLLKRLNFSLQEPPLALTLETTPAAAVDLLAVSTIMKNW